jgi:hypothetical protein
MAHNIGINEIKNNLIKNLNTNEDKRIKGKT